MAELSVSQANGVATSLGRILMWRAARDDHSNWVMVPMAFVATAPARASPGCTTNRCIEFRSLWVAGTGATDAEMRDSSRGVGLGVFLDLASQFRVPRRALLLQASASLEPRAFPYVCSCSGGLLAVWLVCGAS